VLGAAVLEVSLANCQRVRGDNVLPADLLLIALAGPVAEQKLFDYPHAQICELWQTAWSGDRANVLQRLRGIYNKAEALYYARKLVSTPWDILKADRHDPLAQTCALVERHWRSITRVAALLASGDVLSGADIDAALISHHVVRETAFLSQSPALRAF
jgi:hypothetical protein